MVLTRNIFVLVIGLFFGARVVHAGVWLGYGPWTSNGTLTTLQDISFPITIHSPPNAKDYWFAHNYGLLVNSEQENLVWEGEIGLSPPASNNSHRFRTRFTTSAGKAEPLSRSCQKTFRGGLQTITCESDFQGKFDTIYHLSLRRFIGDVWVAEVKKPGSVFGHKIGSFRKDAPGIASLGNINHSYNNNFTSCQTIPFGSATYGKPITGKSDVTLDFERVIHGPGCKQPDAYTPTVIRQEGDGSWTIQSGIKSDKNQESSK